MLAEKIIKTMLFRGVASLLLLLSLAMLATPESNLYSPSKNFVKSPAPQSNNFVFVSSDDVKDADEDGAIDVQFTSDFLTESFAFISLRNQAISYGKSQINHIFSKVFINFHQLRI